MLLRDYSEMTYTESVVLPMVMATRCQKQSCSLFYLIVNNLFQIFRTPNSYIDIKIIKESHGFMLTIFKDKIDGCLLSSLCGYMWL